MGYDELVIIFRVLVAIVLGGLIGMERTLHGRPAGFRTHALVCLTSALLMIAMAHQGRWLGEIGADAISAASSRMAQGIMTGIGFLRAGVIFKEGLTVRGLTTAASIRVTASIGILVGIGFWVPALLGTLATLIALSVFRAIEVRLPTEFYVHHHMRFKREAVMPEEKLRALVGSYGFTMASLSSRLASEGKLFEYRMVIATRDHANVQKLAQHLLGLKESSSSASHRT